MSTLTYVVVLAFTLYVDYRYHICGYMSDQIRIQQRQIQSNEIEIASLKKENGQIMNLVKKLGKDIETVKKDMRRDNEEKRQESMKIGEKFTILTTRQETEIEKQFTYTYEWSVDITRDITKLSQDLATTKHFQQQEMTRIEQKHKQEITNIRTNLTEMTQLQEDMCKENMTMLRTNIEDLKMNIYDTERERSIYLDSMHSHLKTMQEKVHKLASEVADFNQKFKEFTLHTRSTDLVLKEQNDNVLSYALDVIEWASEDYLPKPVTWGLRLLRKYFGI